MNRMTRPLALMLSLVAGQALAAENFIARNVNISDRKAVIATVEPVHEILARARIGGTIARLTIKEGDFVDDGIDIATIADPKLALQMQALDARLRAQQAQRDQARLDLDRAEELRRTGTIAQARLDEARTRFEVAQRNLGAAQSERDVIGQQSAEGAVLAPGAGRVLKVPVTEGSVVMAGETIATIAAESYVLRLQLPERHARSMKAGDAILIGARGLAAEPQESLRRGAVKLVYPQIDQGRVIADVEVPELGDYFVGERTRVYVATGTRRAIVVPPDFVYRRFGVSYVRLKDSTEVVVQPGMPSEAGLEILSGLRDGDELVKP